MRYVAWQVSASVIDGKVCPTCLNIRLFLVPMALGLVVGAVIVGVLF